MGLRTLAERSTHRIVLRRRLPAPFSSARIFATSEGGLSYLKPRLDTVDPELLRLAAELVRPGDVIWDIGANLGLFSLAASVAAGPDGQVLAVEPDTEMASLLRRSARGNQENAKIEVFPAAVAGQAGVSRFHIARRNRATNYLDGFGTTQTGGIRATNLVPTVTLDWLAAHFPCPDLIKIDVEGAEAQVLAGAEEVLRKAPTIICEVARSSAAAVAAILGQHGYVIYDGDQLPAKRAPLLATPANTLAISGVPSPSPAGHG